MKSKFACYLLSLLVPIGYSLPSSASWFSSKKDEPKTEAKEDISKKYTNISVDAASQTEAIKLLKEFEQHFKANFQTIENDLALGNNRAAYTLAKETLDSVRIKMGIDPKAKRTEGLFVNMVFPASATRLDGLSAEQKFLVIKALSDFRGGLFMELLNLSKRTSLIYTKAFQGELERDGGLTEEDRQKIIKDLAVAILMPIPLIDRNENKIIVFVDEFANADHTYMFNRDLFQYIEKNQSISMKREAFNTYLSQVKTSLMLPPSIGATDMAKTNAGICMNSANAQTTYEKTFEYFKDCFDRYAPLVGSFAACINVVESMKTQLNFNRGDYQIHLNAYSAVKDSSRGKCEKYYGIR